jgi:hypothetical protein
MSVFWGSKSCLSLLLLNQPWKILLGKKFRGDPSPDPSNLRPDLGDPRPDPRNCRQLSGCNLPFWPILSNYKIVLLQTASWCQDKTTNYLQLLTYLNYYRTS